jgi:hypothetical protein
VRPVALSEVVLVIFDGMLLLALLDAATALLLALWLRALLRARGGDIPCTTRVFSWTAVAVAVVALVGLVVANVLALRILDPAVGRALSPLRFTLWLLAMSASAILFVIALVAFHTNRTAAAWIRLVVPAQLVVRRAGESSTLTLTPGSVRALGIVEGSGGLLYVQYVIDAGEGPLALLVPFTRDAAAASDGTPRLDGVRGLIAQGEARALHRHLAPFCQPSGGAASP